MVIWFPIFFACSVTPCTLTMTTLPERMTVYIHYLAQYRLLYILVNFTFLLYYE